jgi:hexosaminidase
LSRLSLVAIAAAVLAAMPIVARPAGAQTGAGAALTVVPRPDSIELDSGAYVLRSPVRIVVATPSRRLREIAGLLRGWLASPSGFRVVVARGAPRRGDIALALDRAAGDSPEAYTLTVSPTGIRIAAPGTEGVLWGAQTLRQLLPPAFEDAASRGTRSWSIPALVIHDAPRFGWRGSMMDAGRHFFPAPFVKRFVDLLSRYKMNVLHWHLTDDQGWRLEIRHWPRLTDVGAWRTEADGSRYGGFYTQAEVRSVVEYARLRGVTVVPEIEMPGHSVAAIASYPTLGCTGDSIAVANTWGVHQDVYCPREKTFSFLEDVLAQVLDLFPSRYIHIGGDEVPKDRWRACADCQELMRAERLKNEAELESWFVGRIESWLNARGRQLVGWDEITEGGLAPNAVVEVWRDTATIAAVARQGHAVIAAPGSHTYLDHGPGSLTLERVYSFQPIPASLTPEEGAHILGGEAPLWSEGITTANFDVMAFPRLLAFSEALWSRGPRDLADFRRRMAAGQAPRLAALGVGVGPEDRDLLGMVPVYDSTTDNLRMRVERGIGGIDLRYTDDGSAPTPASPLYADSVAFSAAGTIRFQAFFRGEPLGDGRTITIAAGLARGHPYTTSPPPSPRYPGTGTRTLTDGAFGSLDLHDGLWQGWQGADVEAVLDLGRPTPIAAVEGSFLQATRSWVLLPREVTVWLSDDGTTWREAGTATHDKPAERADPFVYRLTVAVPTGATAQWVKVQARNAGPLPAWHPGAGSPSWIFCDEIVVR